ncbi:MAG: YigZ family protein [Odoribacteraceae bacterium]|nr:YigZ family protein [Odoribacteraceae bacterium]
MKDDYRTVAGVTEGVYKEKGSRFIARVYPVTTEEEIKAIVVEVKARYFDARHHCYAWLLGADAKNFRVNDDGEPSSTAGKPILGQILSRDLTNVLVVVVRYFGGTKLGVSGLIQAYRAAAAEALDRAEVIEKTVTETLRVVFSYLAMNDVMRVLKEENPEVLERDFELTCHATLRAPRRAMPRLRERLLSLESVQEIE